MNNTIVTSIAAVVFVGLLAIGIAYAGPAAPPTYFAHVKPDGTVDNVIVASQAFIQTGAEGSPSEWIQTSTDSSVSEGYASIGYKHYVDPVTKKDAFLRPGANPVNYTYSITTNQWKSPADLAAPQTPAEAQTMGTTTI